MKPSPSAIAAAIVFTAAVMGHAPQARASLSLATAAASCQASRHSHEAGLRKRPLGFRNDGTSSVFISCGLQWGYFMYQSPSAFVVATNLTERQVELSCTLVDGWPLPGEVAYYTRTVSLPPFAFASVEWVPSELYGGASLSNYENVSCNVPPGVEINLVGYQYTQPDP